MRRALAVALALVLLGPAAARADDVSEAELRSLAREAATSPAARARLRGIDSVDGAPADLRPVLAGDDAEVRRRLEELAGTDGSGRPKARAGGDVRGDARDIVDDRRFTGTDVPRPFTGVLTWIGDRIEAVLDWFGGRLERMPGPTGLAQVVVALVVLALAIAVASRIARRRSVALAGGGGRRRRGGREDPAELEREADAAEAAGDWERAVRLRFRAGLLRLGERDVIAYRPSLTTGEVARAVRSPAFDDLGEGFDRIAYGGAPASAEDAARQRERWAEVLR